jgi:hypothetical protein
MLSEDEIKKIGCRIESRFQELTESETPNADSPPEILYHYTSAEGLCGIIQSREIWSTNALYLNDTSELRHASDMLGAELQALPLRIKERASVLSRGIPSYANELPLDHFIASFCEDKDLLSQWRGYASGSGYAVGFSSTALRAIASKRENKHRGACTLRKVHYSPQKQQALIRDRIVAINEILEPMAEDLEPTSDQEVPRLTLLWNQIAASFHPTLALMKHPAFAAENEWRLIRTLWKPPVPMSNWPVRLRVIGGRLAPYLPIGWPLPNTPPSDEVRGVREVLCGPSNTPELMKKAAGDLLVSGHCWGTRVLHSTIPLRV